MYATKMHFEILRRLVEEAEHEGGSLAVAFISYGNMPHCVPLSKTVKDRR
jgi:hypothetical protein